MLARRLANSMAAIAIGLAALVAAPGHAENIKLPGLPELPNSTDECATGTVLSNLKRDVDHKFRSYAKTRLVVIKVIDPVEHYARDRDETHTVARKWCRAKVRMSDRKIRDIWYILEKPWGLAGAPLFTGVEFCIVGLDPWKTYGKDCSTIRNAIGW